MDKNEIKEEFDNLKKLVDDWNKRDKEFTEKVGRIIFDKNGEIAELNRSNMNLGKEIYGLKKAKAIYLKLAEESVKEIYDLEKENERLNGTMNALNKENSDLLQFSKELKQKLANRDKEWVGKIDVIADELERFYSHNQDGRIMLWVNDLRNLKKELKESDKRR